MSCYLDRFPKVRGLTVPLVVSPAQVESIKTLELFASDTWVVTYPKCGTTWMQQIVALVSNKGEEDGRKINESVPWIEAANNPDPDYDYKVDISALKSPRSFKSHFPYDLMPCGVPNETSCKYIYVARNPKDVAVSYYHHYLGFKYVPKLDWDTYMTWFLSGQVVLGDYFDHVLSWWHHREEGNILFMKYEDMKRDLHSAVKLVSDFMGHSLAPSVIDTIASKCTFSSMKDNPGANYTWASHRRAHGATPFMRKGIVGDWKECFSEEQSALCDELYHKKFKTVGLEFDFE